MNPEEIKTEATKALRAFQAFLKEPGNPNIDYPEVRALATSIRRLLGLFRGLRQAQAEGGRKGAATLLKRRGKNYMRKLAKKGGWPKGRPRKPKDEQPNQNR